MSPSMWTWRVIFPGLGLLACSWIFWHSSTDRGGEPVTTSATPPALTARPVWPGRVIAEGRIVARPGAEVNLASEAGGLVVSVQAVERARVKKGDVLIEFRSDDLKLAVAEAEAKLAEADAELAFSQAEHQRKIQIKSSSTPPEREIEASRRDVQVAVARRKAIEAGVGRARIALGRTRITSPIDGSVISSRIVAGEVAVPGATLVTICDLSRLRIEAEVDEFDVARISPGDEVIVSAEGHGDTTWQGLVDDVPERVAPRTLTPDDPGRPPIPGFSWSRSLQLGRSPSSLASRLDSRSGPRKRHRGARNR